MGTLFAHTRAGKSRVYIMFGASLLLHSGIVGVAEMWAPPQPQKGTVEVSWSDEYSEGHPLPLPPKQTSDLAPATPTPPLIDEPVMVISKVSEDPIFSEPIQTPKAQKPKKSIPLTSQHFSHVMVTGTGPVLSSSNSSDEANGSPVSTAAPDGSWVTPHPLYPQSMMKRGSAVATTVHIVTDVNGQISRVTIIKSAGNPQLDSYTEMYVRSHWRGPANASRNTEFIYQSK